MSLLLKALKQVDWHPVEALETVAVEPQVPPPRLPPQPREPISLDALFDVPPEEIAEKQLATKLPPEPLTIEVAAPADATLAGLSITAETPLERLESLQSLLATETVKEVLQNDVDLTDSEGITDGSRWSRAAIPPEDFANNSPDPSGVAENGDPAVVFPIRPEITDLCDHLFAKHTLPEHATLLLVDAGRVVQDAAWAMEFAAAVAAKRQAAGGSGGQKAGSLKVLLVEAAGPQCGIAPAARVNTHPGLCALLRGDIAWRDAVQSTAHPHVKILGRGVEPLWPDKAARLTTVWNELRNHFDVLLVATGPWMVSPQLATFPIGPAAEVFAPLADAAVLCVELDGTPQVAALKTQAELVNRGINVLGCVVRGRTTAA